MSMLLTGSILVAAACFYLLYIRLSSVDPPETRIITALYCYPIKSFRGVRLDQTDLIAAGLRYDRIYTLATRDATTGKYQALTSWDRADVARFSIAFVPSIEPTHIRVSVLDSPATLLLPLAPPSSSLDGTPKLPFQIMGSGEMDAYDMADYAEFFRPFFPADMDVRLLYKGPKARRLTGNGTRDLIGYDGETAFASVFPLLLANEASLDDLNERMGAGEDMSMERFRPNVVVSGGPPWDEDDWTRVRIVSSASDGAAASAVVDIDVVCRCMRCPVTGIDPVTAIQDKREPLRAMSKFRRIDAGSPAKSSFGMLAVPRPNAVSTHCIAVGDTLQVLKRGSHRYIKGY